MDTLFSYHQNYTRENKREVKDESIRTQVAKVLRIDNVPDWAIVDQKQVNGHMLYQVNFVPTGNLVKYGYLKGVVVDLEARTQVSQSWGYTPGTILDELVPDDKGKLTLTDHRGLQHEFDLAHTIIKPVFEGAIISIFKSHGEVHYSINTSMYAERGGKNHFGHMGNYKNVYFQLGGPREDILFNPYKDYSPYTYTFLIMRKELMSSMKLDPGKDGFLVYLGAFCNWDVNSPPYPIDKCELIAEFDENHEEVLTEFPEYDIVEPFVYAPPSFSLEQANNHLRYGWSAPYNDKLTHNYHRSGEGIVLIDAQTRKSLFVYSNAYAWRRTIRGEEATLKQALYVRLNDAYLINEEFNDKYPIMAEMDLWSCEELCNEGQYIVTWPSSIENMPINTVMDKMTIVWLSLLISCPPPSQPEVWKLMNQYYSDKVYLMAELQNLIKMRNGTLYYLGKDLPANIRDLLSISIRRSDGTINGALVQLKKIIDDEMDGAEFHRMVKLFRKNKK